MQSLLEGGKSKSSQDQGQVLWLEDVYRPVSQNSVNLCRKEAEALRWAAG